MALKRSSVRFRLAPPIKSFVLFTLFRGGLSDLVCGESVSDSLGRFPFNLTPSRCV
jgi:hypothetical protein